MRKTLLLMVLVSLGGEAFAQGFTYGIKAGLNIANYKVAVSGISGSSDDLISFHVGFYGVLMTSEKFGFQPELVYSAQGGGGTSSSGSNSTVNLNFINVPLMLRFDLGSGVNLHAGPQVGFLLNATAGGINIKSDLNSVEVGLGFGLGVERPSGFAFGFRYNLGLTNMLTSAASSSGSAFGLGNITMTNQVIQLSIGHRFSSK